jgi:hypothetical protein
MAGARTCDPGYEEPGKNGIALFVERRGYAATGCAAQNPNAWRLTAPAINFRRNNSNE